MNATAQLKLLNGSEEHSYPLNKSQETVLGRDPSCQIALDSNIYGGVSRRHAVVQFKSALQLFEISDLGSSNGTYVNGQRLSGNQALKSGDRIQLGANGVEFRFEDPTVPETVVGSSGNAPGRSASSPTIASPTPAYQSPPATPAYQPPHSAPAYQAPYQPPQPSPAAAPQPQYYSAQPVSTSNKSGTRNLILIGSLLAVALAAGVGIQSYLRNQSTSETATAPTSTAPDTNTPSSETGNQPANAPATSGNVQTYTDPNGLFQVELPADYSINTREDGIEATSPDGTFLAVVTAVRVPRELGADELVRGFTSQQNSNPNLSEFTVQNTEPIEGGVQVAWVGRLTSDITLDAITHFLQQNGVLVEVDLSAVDRAFTEQDANEGRAILQSLQIGQ